MDVVVNPGTAYPLQNSLIEPDLDSTVILGDIVTLNQTEKLEEITEHSENTVSDCLVKENPCSALLTVWPDEERTIATKQFPEPNYSDENPNSKQFPEPNYSDDNPNSQQIPEPNYSDYIPNSQPVFKPNWSDDITNSPYIYEESYMRIGANSQNIPAPLGADGITADPQEVSTVKGMHAPLGTQQLDNTTWYQQMLSNRRHESIWLSSTDGGATNVDFPDHDGVNTNDIFKLYSSFKPRQDMHMHDPDQVVHTLYPISTSNQQDLDSVDKGIVSNTNLAERSFQSEQPLCLQVSLPALSDLPGFDTLSQDEATPPAPATTDDTNLPWISSDASMASCSPSLSLGSTLSGPFWV